MLVMLYTNGQTFEIAMSLAKFNSIKDHLLMLFLQKDHKIHYNLRKIVIHISRINFELLEGFPNYNPKFSLKDQTLNVTIETK